MARNKHSSALEFDIEVGGDPYVWRLQRLPRWSKDPKERRGIAIAARHAAGQREAVMEFPAGDQPRYGAPQLQASQIAPALVARAIAAAVAAGWEPLSRGKTVEIAVDANGD